MRAYFHMRKRSVVASRTPGSDRAGLAIPPGMSGAASWTPFTPEPDDHTIPVLSLLAGIGLAIAILLLAMPAPAHARETITCDLRGCSDRIPSTASHQAVHAREHHRRRAPPPAVDANGNGSRLIHVSTAAGIDITVAPDFAPKIEGFIADVVARGYHPRQIHCYASGGHVRGSLHYSGQACDFDQRGWGLTARPMYHVADLAEKWGLRDGGEFRDWGHIDMGPHLRRGTRAAYRKSHPPFYGVTADYRQRKAGG